jgi:hypothetical protein
MANRSDPLALPPAVRRVSSAFRWAGWISFWSQIVLAVVSGIVLLFAASNFGAVSQPVPSTIPGVPAVPAGNTFNPGAGAGLGLAVLGLLALFAGSYWAFRYTRIARQLKTLDAQARPKPGDARWTLRTGLAINLAGMLLTILGAQTIVGSLVGKSFAQGIGIFTGNFARFINPSDIFLVQANTNTIMAHFIGLVATLWILRLVDNRS